MTNTYQEIRLCPNCKGQRVIYYTPYERQGDFRSGDPGKPKYEICQVCNGEGSVMVKVTEEFIQLTDFDFKKNARNLKGVE